MPLAHTQGGEFGSFGHHGPACSHCVASAEGDGGVKGPAPIPSAATQAPVVRRPAVLADGTYATQTAVEATPVSELEDNISKCLRFSPRLPMLCHNVFFVP